MHTSNYSLHYTFSVLTSHPLQNVLFYFVQFAQLIRIQKKLGKENFPLVEQAYYPNHREMVSNFKYRILYIYHQNSIGRAFSSRVTFHFDSYTAPYGLFPICQHSEIINSHLANILNFTPQWSAGYGLLSHVNIFVKKCLRMALIRTK